MEVRIEDKKGNKATLSFIYELLMRGPDIVVE